MVSSSSSLLPSRSRSKDGGVRLQQQRQRHRASGLREGPTRRARLRPRPRRLGGLPRAGGTLSEEEEEEQELLLSEEVFERKGCMLVVSFDADAAPAPRRLCISFCSPIVRRLFEGRFMYCFFALETRFCLFFCISSKEKREKRGKRARARERRLQLKNLGQNPHRRSGPRVESGVLLLW